MSQNGTVVTLITPRADGQGKEYRVMHMDSDHYDGEFIHRCKLDKHKRSKDNPEGTLVFWEPSDEEKITSARKLFVGQYCELFFTEDEADAAVGRYYDDEDNYIEYGPTFLEINIPFSPSLSKPLDSLHTSC
jgi:hypothetical protein